VACFVGGVARGDLSEEGIVLDLGERGEDPAFVVRFAVGDQREQVGAAGRRGDQVLHETESDAV